MSGGDGALAPGALVAGRYRVQGRAGEHPAYARWRAMDSGEEIELWSIRRDLFAASDAAIRFVDDALASRRLDDPHLRKPRDAALVKNGLFVAMTPEGLVPEMLSAREPATDAALLRLARALASGLGAAHALGFVHGRLIPADVVEDSGGGIKVGGVGMWPHVEVAVALEQWQPYRRYLAPEVVAGDEPSARADVLASAALLAAAAVGSAATEKARDYRGLHDAVAAARPDVAIALAEAFDPMPDARPYAVALLVERLDECFTSDGARTGARPRSVVVDEPGPIPGPPPIPPSGSGRAVPALPMPRLGRSLAGVGARRGGFVDEPDTVRVPKFEPPPGAEDQAAKPQTPPAPAAMPPPTPAPAVAGVSPIPAPAPPLRAPSIDDEADIETSAFVRAVDASQEPSAGEVEVSSRPQPTPPPAGPPEIEGLPATLASAPEVPELEALPKTEPARTDTGQPLSFGRGVAEHRSKLPFAVAGALVLLVAGWFVVGAGGDSAASGEQSSEVAAATPVEAAPPAEGVVETKPPRAVEAAPGEAASDSAAPAPAGEADSAAPAPGEPADATPAAVAATPAPPIPDHDRPVAVPIEHSGPCPAGMIALDDDVCIDEYEAPGGGRRPTTGVTLAQARTACESRRARLCTGSEWERACRGRGGASYPYGPAFRPAPCNVSGEIGASGAFPDCKSHAGAFDMGGNAAEWASDGRVRGGSALDSQRGRCSKADARDTDATYEDVGFRCCADAQ